MRVLRRCVLVLLFGASLAHAGTEPVTDTEEADPTAERWAALVVQVYDRDAASEALIAEAEARGGWFSSLDGDQVSFRIPGAELDAFLDFTRTQGAVVARDYRSEDRSEELTDLRSRLEGREEILGRYMEVLEEARSGAVVRVEQQITRAISEIEQIKGRIIFLENRVQYAQVDVSFQFRNRSAPVRTGHSSFRWLNQLNLSDLMADFHQHGKGLAPARGLNAAVPEGFAAYHERKRVREVSPDGVVYRVRIEKNRPEADLAFWEEAMKARMLEAGYHMGPEGSETRIQSGAHEGALLELSAADGERDQSYLVAVFVQGKKLVIIEAAGTVERFAPRREAITAAISDTL